jgi:DNA-binding GntR family transcriptional regulator
MQNPDLALTSRITPIVLYQEVAERLRQKIYTYELKPGESIDEQALAESFGISRTPLREALKVLHSEGLVVLKPRRGCFVAELTEQDLDEIFPVMALLEGRCAYDAVRKARPTDLKRLDDIHARLEKYAAAEDIERYYEQNYLFHEAVQKLAGNLWLQKTVGDLRKFLKLLRGRQLRLPGRLEASLKEHRLIMAAFHNQNPAAAEKIMHDHLLAQRQALARYDVEEYRPQEPRVLRKTTAGRK